MLLLFPYYGHSQEQQFCFAADVNSFSFFSLPNLGCCMANHHQILVLFGAMWPKTGMSGTISINWTCQKRKGDSFSQWQKDSSNNFTTYIIFHWNFGRIELCVVSTTTRWMSQPSTNPTHKQVIWYSELNHRVEILESLGQQFIQLATTHSSNNSVSSYRPYKPGSACQVLTSNH